MGAGSLDCIATLVESKTGLVLVGKLKERTKESFKRRVVRLIRHNEGAFITFMADNGTELHGSERIEERTGAAFYFARPYHS